MHVRKGRIRNTSTKIIALIAVLFLCFSAPASATSLFRPEEPVHVMDGEEAQPWAFIERHVDPHPQFPEEPFHPKLVQFYQQTIAAFGTKEPHSSTFLLHAMPGWNSSTKPNPILMIHGANEDATRRFTRPLSTAHPDHLTRTGLGQYLAQRGHAVFGISFSHFHGCNLHQGEQVANAISRIRALLGREDDQAFKVDLITYSKGAMAARCYVESAGEYYGLDYLTLYRDDIGTIVFQVAPIGGLDLPFRYYGYNLHVMASGTPAPVGARRMFIMGSWQDTGDSYIHSGCFPGQLQMIHDVGERGVPVGPMSYTMDANYTMRCLRSGGVSHYLHSEGLEAARNAGGNLIQLLNELGLPGGVDAVLVAGTHPVLHEEVMFPQWHTPSGMELTDVSDGVLFLKSALYVEGLTGRGARTVDPKTFPLNHIDISRSPDVYEYIAGQLDR